MIRLFEFAAFAAVAIAIHLAFVVVAPPEGQEAGGVGGEALTSIAGAAPTLVELVQTWERPPEIATATPLATAYTQPVLAQHPTGAMMSRPQAARAVVRLNAVQAQTPNEVVIRTTAAPRPEPESAPKAEPEPQPKPKPVVPTPPKPAPKPTPVDPVQPVKKNPPPTKAKPTPDAQKATIETAGRAAQKSAGTGGRAQAGQSSQAQHASLSKGEIQRLVAKWGAKIRTRIDRRKRAVKGLKTDATVVVLLHLDRSGRLLSHRVTKSSGQPSVDASALAAVQRAGKFAKAPKELPGTNYKISVAIKFKGR
ncbi:MAG: TonB family protein [Thalassovita sp.]